MKTLWLAAIAIMLCSGEAAAQIGTGRSGISTSTPVTNAKPFKELQEFGNCLARTSRKTALAVVATVPDSREEDKVLKKFVYGERVTCLSGGTEMQMPYVFARGAIAEGLLRSGGVPAEYRLPAPTPAAVRDLHGVARCYTSGHRGEVEKLLQTSPGSAQEVKAVAAIWDGFRACMPGANVRLNAPWIRYLLAEALLRTSGPAAATGAK